MNKDILAQYDFLDKMTFAERCAYIDARFAEFVAMMEKRKAKTVGVETVEFTSN